MAPFLVPGAAFLQQAALNRQIPGALIHSWLWDCIVMPHETWALLLLSLVLLCGIMLDRAHASKESLPLKNP
jgi:hypothetical protein